VAGYSQSMVHLIEQLRGLPGIGNKTAERLAYHILRCDRDEALALADAIRAVKEKIRTCRQCFHMAEDELCDICKDTRRDGAVVCVVEQPKDLLAIEETGNYHGLYHVLHGHIAPLDGVGPDQLTIEALVNRVRGGGVREIIMGTNPNLEGDGTALYISNVLSALGVEITRLARGLASGSVLEFANKTMLSDALGGRQKF